MQTTVGQLRYLVKVIIIIIIMTSTSIVVLSLHVKTRTVVQPTRECECSQPAIGTDLMMLIWACFTTSDRVK